jgi:hypothetical protein
MPEPPVSNVTVTTEPTITRDMPPPHQVDAAALAAIEIVKEQGTAAGSALGGDHGYGDAVRFLIEQVGKLPTYRQSGEPVPYTPSVPTGNLPGGTDHASQAVSSEEASASAPGPLPSDETAALAALSAVYIRAHRAAYAIHYKSSFGAALDAAADMTERLALSWQSGEPKATTRQPPDDEAKTQLGVYASPMRPERNSPDASSWRLRPFRSSATFSP